MPDSALLTTAIGASLTAITGTIGVAVRSWTRRQAEDERTRALVADLLQKQTEGCEERYAELAEKHEEHTARLRTLELHHAVCGLVSVPPVPTNLPTRYHRDKQTTPTDAEWRAASRSEREIMERLRNIP